MSIETLKKAIEKFLSKYPPPDEDILYPIGTKVLTKGDRKESYIGKIIGKGTEGVTISNCTIPLVDFGSIGTFYVYQGKLKAIN